MVIKKLEPLIFKTWDRVLVAVVAVDHPSSIMSPLPKPCELLVGEGSKPTPLAGRAVLGQAQETSQEGKRIVVLFYCINYFHVLCILF